MTVWERHLRVGQQLAPVGLAQDGVARRAKGAHRVKAAHRPLPHLQQDAECRGTSQFALYHRLRGLKPMGRLTGPAAARRRLQRQSRVRGRRRRQQHLVAQPALVVRVLCQRLEGGPRRRGGVALPAAERRPGVPAAGGRHPALTDLEYNVVVAQVWCSVVVRWGEAVAATDVALCSMMQCCGAPLGGVVAC